MTLGTNHHGLDRTTADTAVALVKRRPQPSELRHLRPVLVAVAALGRGERTTLVKRVRVAHEPLDALREQLLLVAQREVHRGELYSPSTILAMMLRWISFVPA